MSTFIGVLLKSSCRESQPAVMSAVDTGRRVSGFLSPSHHLLQLYSPSGGKERRECLIRLFHSERMTFLFYGLNKSQGKQFSLVVLYLRELNYCDIQTKIVCHLYTKNLRTPQLQTIIELYVNLWLVSLIVCYFVNFFRNFFICRKKVCNKELKIEETKEWRYKKGRKKGRGEGKKENYFLHHPNFLFFHSSFIPTTSS